MKYISFLILMSYIQLALAQITGHRLVEKIYANNNNVDFWKNGEILTPESMFINDKMPCLTTTTILKKNFNKPDSIKDDAATCCTYWESAYEQDWWYGKTTFLTLQDSAIIKEMFFDDDKFFIKTASLTFNKNTTYDEVCKAFPVACKLTKEKEVKSIGTGISTKYTFFDVRMRPDTDDLWAFYFKDGKLIYIGSGSAN